MNGIVRYFQIYPYKIPTNNKGRRNNFCIGKPGGYHLNQVIKANTPGVLMASVKSVLTAIDCDE